MLAAASAALGNWMFAVKGGVVPGLSPSPTIEFLDVPASQP